MRHDINSQIFFGVYYGTTGFNGDASMGGW